MDQIELFYETLRNIKEKGSEVYIKLKKYNTNNFNITQNGREVNNEVRNVILTYYHYSKVKVTNKDDEIYLQGSFKDSSKNPVPLYFNLNNEIYKMEYKK